ncbi:uncharacterized protein K489DRAFT_253880 [Dissoconium aciculare CBS 342.82]|uniref:RING-type domain-containing protein n=1 Tax=Dissoconium aciculare CBS 342.82 TaxID=1314786 RepID=A0A6J3M2F4_9PEZI|nr:uncharacterized protein K489DRAFT_253880 [Dissoconium aciculare CBS 342.82]KAF1821679.1 hypothetical protein K489DRAFT_253880 [Dissoconium aciculare CBS 342.82]
MPVQTRPAKKRAAEQDGAEPSEATQSVQMLECQTCYEDGPGLAFGHAVHADVSGHEHFNCYNCWERCIKDRLDDEKSAEISCLHCPRKLEEQDMRILNKHFATDLYARWLDHVALALAKADPKWKSCPSQTCPGGCIVDDGYIFTCPTCNLRYCTSCNIPMHEDESCSQYRNRDARIIADEQASLAKVAEISKPCPKCSSKLSKAGGCDHMTCAICRHDFCWGVPRCVPRC